PGGVARPDDLHRRFGGRGHRAVDRLVDRRPCAPGARDRAQFRRLARDREQRLPSAQRGQAIGIWAAAGTIGQALGPLVGGVLTEKLSWRWFFFVNVPLGIAAILLTLYVVEESRDESAPRRFDLRGFVMLTVGRVLVVLGV